MSLKAYWQTELRSPDEIELTKEAWRNYSEQIGVEIANTAKQFRQRCDELRLILLDTQKRLIELRDEMD